jgi:hypothetical protein
MKHESVLTDDELAGFVVANLFHRKSDVPIYVKFARAVIAADRAKLAETGGTATPNVYICQPTPSALLEASEKFFGLQENWGGQGIVPAGYWEASNQFRAAIEAYKKGQS